MGVTVGPAVISAGYSLGLGNMQPDVSISGYDFNRADWKISHRVISVNVAYFFMDN